MKVIGSTIAFTHRSLGDALRGIAELGFDEVDVLAMTGWAHFDPAELLDNADGKRAEIDAVTEECGLKVIAFNAKQTFQMNTPDPGEQAQNLREQLALVELARSLGVPRMTLQPGAKESGRGLQESLDLSINAFGRLLAEVGGDDPVIAYEPHADSVAETYDAMRSLLDEVPGLTVTYDPSHFVKMDWDVKDSEFLFARTGNVHLRDAVPGNLQAPLGEGQVDFEWVMDGLKRSPYDGTMSIEYIYSPDRDIIPDTLKLRDLLEGMIGE